MYYNRILRVWALDSLDYFLLSAILGSISASRLKNYLSETKAMERLKNSIIKKSKLVIQSNKSDRPVPNSKERNFEIKAENQSLDLDGIKFIHMSNEFI